ncbi:MAG: lysylphosphatidylglycerol synthase transmembrane domain-containing protein [Pseudomonadota bacterium]
MKSDDGAHVRSGWRAAIPAIAGIIAIVAGASIFSDIDRLGARLGEIGPTPIVLALTLALGNFAIRFVRWQLYVRRVATAGQIPIKTSLLVFLAGFAMSVTPGKVGELLKAVLLKQSTGVPMARTAPLVVAERLTDLVALLVLGLIGTAIYGIAFSMVVAGAVAIAVFLAVLASPPLVRGIIRKVGALPRLRRYEAKLHELYDNLTSLLRPGPLAWATSLAVLAWLCECVGFALIVNAVPAATVPVGLATLIYAATTMAGALSFLPGGLVVTEASMVLLLVCSAKGLDEPGALAATLVTRLCTLWFAVVLGLLALVAARRVPRHRSPTSG